MPTLAIVQFALQCFFLFTIASWPSSYADKTANGDYIQFSEKKWDEEWSGGRWDYMEKNGVEKSRNAIIGGVLCQLYANSNSSILDVGCGEGPISDYIHHSQKPHYVGLDISKEAIRIAKTKRGPPLRFVHGEANSFSPLHKFDVIIFSEVLYYLDHTKIIDKYDSFLNPGGVVIISVFHLQEELLPKHKAIFTYARGKYDLLDEINVSGFIRKNPKAKPLKTALHMEVFKQRRDRALP